MLKKILNKLVRTYNKKMSSNLLNDLIMPLSLPKGYSEKKLFNFVTSVRVTDAPEEEMRAYGTHDFKRFVYTWGLTKGLNGKCLELGANPYFTTTLLNKFGDLDLTLANYFGDEISAKKGTQKVVFTDPDSGLKGEKRFNYNHFNIENHRFPYKDGSFDVVIFGEIIEHLLNDPCKVLREIKRVLKPNGSLILTTPNVARLENICRLIQGENIYDPYSGYGPYGRHNREYNRHELIQLLEFEGFNVNECFTSDVHHNNASIFFDPLLIQHHLKFREKDLGQYIFLRAKNSPSFAEKKPRWLYRSYDDKELV